MVPRFEIDPAHTDESQHPEETTTAYVCRIAEQKALTVAQRWPGAAVLGADTAVVLGDRILGKPVDDDDAVAMLQLLSGQRHRVLSAVCLQAAESTPPRTELSVTEVEFADLPAAWIAAYVRSGEPRDKAGAYAIQGGAGPWVRRIEGSYTGVVGLPLFETARLLRAAGLMDLGTVAVDVSSSARGGSRR